MFETNFLNKHLNLYPLSKIDGLTTKKEILNDWLQRYKSGKLLSQNETSIGADFLNDIFGEVLGFNYRNPYFWNLEKELKTNVDGKKPDGVIGYFEKDKEPTRNVHGIIELKDANTPLDKAQNRSNDKRTPVEQAFSYAPKYGQKCKWVIVSNFIEIRLYQANDQSKFEAFHLENLQKEQVLKKFFFLLQKENLLIKSGTSRVQRLIQKSNELLDQKINNPSSHLLDKLYNLIKKFDGLPYVDPNILANAEPFNCSKEYVWNYSKFCLKSTEDGFFDFFSQVSVEKSKILPSPKLIKELEQEDVIEYQSKLEFIINRLNDYSILYIECYNNSNKDRTPIKFSIDARKQDKSCNCLMCCYKRLDFTTLLKELRRREGGNEYNTLETAYFHSIFGTNNFKTSYLIYKSIVSNEKGRNEFIYFLAKYNLIRLHNLVDRNYKLEDKEEIMDHIRAIDLDLILHELDVIDPDKRRALVELKGEKVKKRVENSVDEKIKYLQRAKSSFKRSKRASFPNYTFQLNQALNTFLLHYNLNYTISGIFVEYKKVCEKILRGYLISYSINEGYSTRLRKLECHHINLIIFDLSPLTVEKLFKDCEISEVLLSSIAKKDLLDKTKNFLQSNHNKEFVWSPSENDYLSQLTANYHFRDLFNNIFQNLFIMLSMIKLNKEECENFIPVLIRFLEVDRILYPPSLKTLSVFISRNGNYFTDKELVEILNLTLTKKVLGNDSCGLTRSICHSLYKRNFKFGIEDEVLVQKIILTNKERTTTPKRLIKFWHISNESNKKVIENEFFKALESDFSPCFYRELLLDKIINIDYKDYFNKYLEYVDNMNRNCSYELWEKEPQLSNYCFVNFAFLIYALDIDISNDSVNVLTDLVDWQKWLINLENFDYSKFKAEWILIANHEVFYERFKQIPQIGKKIKETLKQEYHERLAKIFIKYF